MDVSNEVKRVDHWEIKPLLSVRVVEVHWKVEHDILSTSVTFYVLYASREQWSLVPVRDELLIVLTDVTAMSANLSRKFLRALECPYCSRQFVSRRELLVHQWSHKERAAYQCTQCEKTFTREELFRRHMVNHQKEESAKVTCEICNKTFRNQRTLEQHHLKTHAGK